MGLYVQVGEYYFVGWGVQRALRARALSQDRPTSSSTLRGDPRLPKTVWYLKATFSGPSPSNVALEVYGTSAVAGIYFIVPLFYAVSSAGRNFLVLLRFLARGRAVSIL